MRNIGFILFGVSFLFTACTKEPGEGGTSALTGKVSVMEVNYDPLEQEYDTVYYYAEKEDVFIIYGSDESAVYDDSFETSWDGTYHFEYLRKGDYKLFVYSDCDSCLSGKAPVFLTATVEQNNEVYSLPDLVIQK